MAESTVEGYTSWNLLNSAVFLRTPSRRCSKVIGILPHPLRIFLRLVNFSVKAPESSPTLLRAPSRGRKSICDELYVLEHDLSHGREPDAIPQVLQVSFGVLVRQGPPASPSVQVHGPEQTFASESQFPIAISWVHSHPEFPNVRLQAQPLDCKTKPGSEIARPQLHPQFY